MKAAGRDWNAGLVRGWKSAAVMGATGVLFSLGGTAPVQAEQQCARYPCSVVRTQDLSGERVSAVSGWWYSEASGRAQMNIVKYVVRLVARNADDSIRASVEFGVIDTPELVAPLVFTNCVHCYDEAEGYPAPEGWLDFGPIGPMAGPAEFLLQHDEATGSWAWFINNELVRLDAATRMGPAARIEVGAQVYAFGDGGGEFWHNLVKIKTARGWSTFLPLSADLIDSQYGDSYRSFYLADGSVGVTGTWDRASAARAGVRPGIEYSGGISDGIVLDHDLLHVSSGRHVLSLDTSAGSPVVAQTTLPDAVRDLAMCGSRIVGVTESGDVFAAESVGEGLGSVTRIGVGHRALHVACAGGVAYVSGDSAALDILDLGEGSSARRIGSLAVRRGRIRKVAAVDGLLAVGTETASSEWALGEVYLYGTDDPHEPVYRGSVAMAGAVTGAACLSGSACWVADATGQVCLVDVGAEEVQGAVDCLETTGPIDDVVEWMSDGVLVSAEDSVMVLRRDSDGIAVENRLELHGGGRLAVADSGVFYMLSRWGRVQRVELGTAGRPESVRLYQMVGAVRDAVAVSGAEMVALAGSHVQSLSGYGSEMEAQEIEVLPGSGVAIARSEASVLVAAGLSGLFRSRRDVAWTPFERVPGSGGSLDVVSAGDLAVTAAGARGVRVFEKVAPDAFAEVGYCDVAGLAQRVGWDGRYVYVGTRFDGMHVVDITLAGSPAESERDGSRANIVSVALGGSDLFGGVWSGEVKRWRRSESPMGVGEDVERMTSPVFGVAVDERRLGAVAIDGSYVVRDLGQQSGLDRYSSGTISGAPQDIEAVPDGWVVSTGPAGVAMIGSGIDVLFLPWGGR